MNRGQSNTEHVEKTRTFKSVWPSKGSVNVMCLSVGKLGNILIGNICLQES